MLGVYETTGETGLYDDAVAVDDSIIYPFRVHPFQYQMTIVRPDVFFRKQFFLRSSSVLRISRIVTHKYVHRRKRNKRSQETFTKKN